MRTPRLTAQVPEVALLIETSTDYGRGLLRGILRYAWLHGPWSLHVAPGHLDQTLHNSNSWSFNGIIARIRSAEMERMILATRIPCVVSSLIGSWTHMKGSNFGELQSTHEEIARIGLTHLLETGLRRFAFCGFAACRWSSHREKAFIRFSEEMGYPCAAHHINMANWIQRPNWISSWQYEEPILVRWLKSLQKPVGVMACNDACGREVLQACARAGLHIPDEVAVLGVDNDEMMCELSHPALSIVALDLEKAGYEADQLLDRLMKHQSHRERAVLIRPTHIAVRRSSDVIVQEDSLVARALTFIREHGKRSMSVSHITEEVGVSRRTLERRFYRAVGRTVLSEIMRSHLTRAKQLLLDTDLLAARVAAEAGFGSLKSFNRIFSRKEGRTPMNFRKNSTTVPSSPPVNLPTLSTSMRNRLREHFGD